MNRFIERVNLKLNIDRSRNDMVKNLTKLIEKKTFQFQFTNHTIDENSFMSVRISFIRENTFIIYIFA